MSLTQIQQDAIAKARRGDYSLLDAMELEHRIRKDGAAHGYRVGGRLRLIAYGDPVENPCSNCAGGGTVQCEAADCDEGQVDCVACETLDHTVEHTACGGTGCESPGCIEGQVECEKCRGTGDLPCEECHGDGHVECPECGGAGELPPDEWEDLRIRNLDGRVLWREDDPAEPPHPSDWEGMVDLEWADSILAAYRKELRDAAEAAAAAPADATAGQTTIALEIP